MPSLRLLNEWPWGCAGDFTSLPAGSFQFTPLADNSWLTGVDQGDGTFRFELPGDWVPLGWCDASTIRIRPRSGQIVVLFSDESREFWQHLMPM
jgi:hypothetical protein